MPYHPPSSDAYTETLRWFLVAVPDKPEYLRAAKGAYTELSKFWIWDADVGDNNAAADSFDEAIDETLRALELGFPDELLGYIDEVETLLRQISKSNDDLICCPDVPGADTLVSDVPSNLETSDTDVAGGTFPDGKTAGEFETYLCNAATAYVDMLIELPDDAVELFQTGFATLVTIIVVFTTGAYIGIAGALAGVVTVTTILNLIDILDDIIAGITDGTEDSPTVPSQELLDAKDDLVCAITQANDAASAASALRNAIGDAVTSIGWENLLLLWPHETLLAKVFNGDAEGAPAAECSCGLDFDFIHDTDQADIEAGNDGYENNGVTRVNDALCDPDMWRYAFGNSSSTLGILAQGAANNEGYTTPTTYDAYIVKVEMDVCNINGSYARVQVNYADGTNDRLDNTQLGTVEWVPPNGETKKVANTSGGVNSIVYSRPADGGFNLTGMRVYYRIVET